MPAPPKRAAKRPLQGWVAQVWVETLKGWYDMTGSPIFKNPDDAVRWAIDQHAGWPT